MELSSPLAAMQPPPCPAPWGCRSDVPTSRPLFSNPHAFGTNSFNFNNMNLKKSGSDYFAIKPMRGSSPAVSLAADLSQNFHIDQSPQLATPRRSLFTSNLLHISHREGTKTPPVRWEGVTTPPIPSSSPGFGNEMELDCSPLPHKTRGSTLTDIAVESPVSPTASDEDMFSSCSTLSASSLEIPRSVSLAERKRATLLRPSLSRSKHFSTNTVALSSKENSLLQPFKFEAGSNTLLQASPLSLDDCFVPSPPQQRSTVPSVLMGPPRPRQPFSISTNMGRSNGLPWSAPVRRPAGPPSRRPSKFRRSLSMYEHPGDVMSHGVEQLAPSPLQAVADVEELPALNLPYTMPDKPDSLPRISNDTLVKVLDGEYDHLYDEIKIIDCRFEYEFNGGHVDRAVNFCDKEVLCEELFKTPSPPKTLLVFHCEFSAHRAPLMAQSVRSRDREVNADRYPMLHYPEVYILEGGYSSFYTTHKTRCNPQNYLRMDAEDYEHACERGMNRLRHRTKLNRAKTFAFGQQSSQVEDSPTAHARSKTGCLVSFSTNLDANFNIGRLNTTRRMASY